MKYWRDEYLVLKNLIEKYCETEDKNRLMKILETEDRFLFKYFINEFFLRSFLRKHGVY